MKQKLLLITDYFYPVNRVPSFRMQAIVQYLSNENFEVSILTCGSAEAPGPETYMGCSVYRVAQTHKFARRTFSWPSKRLMHVFRAVWNRLVRVFEVDERPGFEQWGWPRILELHNEKKFDIVLASFSSLACVKLGLRLKERDPKVMFIADFRDEMSQNYDVNFWDFHRLKVWEKKLVEAADLVTSVSAPILAHFKSVRTRPGNFLELRNGFNFEPIREPKAKGDKLEIVYAGTLYHHIHLQNFFEALKGLPKEVRNRISLKIVGGHPTLSIPRALRPLVRILPGVKHAEVPNLLSQSDAFLLVIPDSNRRGVFTGKIFDYLAVNRPILGLVPQGDVAAHLIEKARAGYTCSNGNVAAIRQTILKLLADWEKGSLPERNWDVVRSHHRYNQVRLLEKTIQELTGRTQAAPAAVRAEKTTVIAEFAPSP